MRVEDYNVTSVAYNFTSERRSQRSLFNVLHAFAMLCHDCGYCQGMGSLAATFLCYAPPEVNANIRAL